MIEWLEQARSLNGKTVVFGSHTEHVQELAEIFSGLPGTRDNSLKQLQAALHDFRNDPEAKFLFPPYGIGSQAWQLDFADQLVMVELDWSDSTHQRAEGRLSSLVREKALRADRLLVRGTYEDHMLGITEEKRAMDARKTK